MSGGFAEVPDDDEEAPEADIYITMIRVNMPCASCGENHEFIATESEYELLMSGAMLLRLCFQCRWA